MITIGADRFRSKAAASPEFGAGSGGNMSDDTSKRLDAIERAILAIEKCIVEMRSKLDVVGTKLDTVLPHLATKAELAPVLTALPHLATKAELAPVLTALPHLASKAELEAVHTRLEAMQAHLIKWVIGMAVSGAAIAAAITTLASRLTWH
jgi:hypothetical protein